MTNEPTPAAIDPVCGMTVNPATAKGGSLEHAGTTYYFCSPGCRQKFEKEPGRYANKAPSTTDSAKGIEHAPPRGEHPVAKTKPVAEAVSEWTCPMHPQIVRNGPGSCPICGMALEPRTVSAEEPENHELTDMSRRFWTSVVLTVPVFALAMTEVLPGGAMGGLLSMQTKTWIEFVLATPICPVGGMALLRPSRPVRGESQPEHVHADRPRRQRGVHLQRHRRARAADFSVLVP